MVTRTHDNLDVDDVDHVDDVDDVGDVAPWPWSADVAHVAMSTPWHRRHGRLDIGAHGTGIQISSMSRRRLADIDIDIDIGMDMDMDIDTGRHLDMMWLRVAVPP